MFGRNVRTNLYLLKPDVCRTVNRKLFSDENKPHRSLTRYSKCWSGIIGQGTRRDCLQTGPVSYRVSANETVWRRHADQLIPGPRSNHDPRFEAEAECENVTPKVNSVSGPPDDSQDELAIAEVKRQTEVPRPTGMLIRNMAAFPTRSQLVQDE